MKKLLTLVFALLLGTSLTFAQAGGGSTGDTKKDDTKKSESKKGTKGGKKGHKGGKKGKKGDKGADTTTPPPK